ncbi:hypothetical protein [Brevibacterium litoralis]|uniref:hypothetical protein n=1 Tax=Brevibacterium litoralis TaxID=3138935 RepID=UPI0032EE3404
MKPGTDPLLAAALGGALVLSGCAVPTSGPEGASPADGATVEAVALPRPAQRIVDDFASPDLRSPAGDGPDGTTGGRGVAASAETAGAGSSAVAHAAVPGLGPETMARIPAETEQVLVSSTPTVEGTTATTTYYERTTDGWVERAAFDGHNGSAGWREDRREGDRTSPIGVFALTDAGGYLPDPGSKLPYTQDESLRGGAAATYGADWAEIFDYVIAINYNRVAGSAPFDDRRPEGWEKGGKVWLHVDHDSPTRACITLEKDEMEYLLTTLDPARTPYIAMGPAEVLSR